MLLNPYLFVWGSFWVCFVSGCGIYSFSGKALPGHIRLVAIPLIENETLEFDLPDRIKERLQQEYLKSQTLKIGELGEAQSSLEIKILQFIDEPATYNAQESVQEYRVLIQLEVNFKDEVKDKILWQAQSLDGSGYYQHGLETREQGKARAIDKLIEEILNKTVAGW